MVSKASEDLPEPDRPVMTVSESRGITTSTFFRLCSRAPRTWMLPALVWAMEWWCPLRRCSVDVPHVYGRYGTNLEGPICVRVARDEQAKCATRGAAVSGTCGLGVAVSSTN